MSEILEKLEGRVTKILDSKMDNFIELGMDDGGSIYVEKGTITYQFKPGIKGTFTYHRTLWGRNKREVRILDGYSIPAPVPIPPQPKVETPQIQPDTKGQNIQIQQIQNQDCLEITKISGKTDGRREEMIRVFGNFSNPNEMKAKLENAKKLIGEAGI